MHEEFYNELTGRINLLSDIQANAMFRLNEIEALAGSTVCIEHHDVLIHDLRCMIDALNCSFEILRNDVNTVLLKLQECVRQENLVDEEGGALDEFIERFVVR